MFKDFVSLCHKLAGTTSRLKKEEYLREYENNDYVKKCLYFRFNPYITTGISKKKISKLQQSFEDRIVDPNYDVLDLLDYIKEHNTGRDVDLSKLENYAEMNSPYADIIYGLVSKELNLGIQATTLNKVYGDNFVPTFDLMLAMKYFDDPDKYLPDGTEFDITTKLDGVRCVCFYDNDSIKFFSRQGQPIYGLNQLEEAVRENLTPGYVYDGELLLNRSDLHSKDLYRATVKVTSADAVKENIVFNIFDRLLTEEFKRGYSDSISRDRKDALHAELQRNRSEFLKEVEILYRGTDKSRIQYWLDKITSEGGEGVMLNLCDSPYECKRSKVILKVKKMQSADLKCIAVEEGTGQNVGRLGAAIVQLPVEDKVYEVSVGSGFTFEDREYFWNNRDEIVGKIIEVQYFEITQNQQGGYSLRFPVFKAVRNDKTEVSMF